MLNRACTLCLLQSQVLDGIAAYSTELRGRYKGRYPNAVRQDLQALLSVVASKCKDLKALAAHVGADYEMLLLRRKVYDDFVAAKGLHPPQCLHDLRSKERSDKTPIEWIEFAKLYFLASATCHWRLAGALAATGRQSAARYWGSSSEKKGTMAKSVRAPPLAPVHPYGHGNSLGKLG